MIKGVNKCILEVGSNESKYFEKVLLFVRPQYAAVSCETLQNDAKKYIGALDIGEVSEPKRDRRAELKRKKRILKIVISATIIAALVGYTFLVRAI